MQDYVGKVFGADYVVANVSKMHGGAQKVVYKIDCTNRFSCILYVWDLTMNYFQEEIANEVITDRSYGSDLFEMNNRYLREHGIQTPALYDLNTERSRYNFDYALVEYVNGQKAEVYFRHSDTREQNQLFERIGGYARWHARQHKTELRKA